MELVNKFLDKKLNESIEGIKEDFSDSIRELYKESPTLQQVVAVAEPLKYLDLAEAFLIPPYGYPQVVFTTEDGARLTFREKGTFFVEISKLTNVENEQDLEHLIDVLQEINLTVSRLKNIDLSELPKRP